jgi:hypothetical protein
MMRYIGAIISDYRRRELDALTFVQLDMNCRIYRDWLQLAKNHYMNSINPSWPRDLRKGSEAVMWMQLFRHVVLREPT